MKPIVPFEPVVTESVPIGDNWVAQVKWDGTRILTYHDDDNTKLYNRKLNERTETIFMMPKDTYTFLSSSIVKEIVALGGDVSSFVPAHVQAALKAKFSK